MEATSDDMKISIAMVNKAWRIYYGNEKGGQYVNVTYDEIRDYAIDKRPMRELINLYFKGSSQWSQSAGK